MCKAVFLRVGEHVVNLTALGGWERTEKNLILFSREGAELLVFEGEEVEEFDKGVRAAIMRGGIEAVQVVVGHGVISGT